MPTFDNLLEFSIKSNELTKEVILTPIIFDKFAHTAYMANGECHLPGLFFTKEFYSEFLEIDENDQIKAAISVINGSQIHEALHHKILGKDADWPNILRTLGKYHPTVSMYPTFVFKNCFNIIEDIYSNYYCSIKYPHIFTFIDLLYQTIFNETIFNKAYEAVYKSKQISDVLNLLACYTYYENTLIENQAQIDYKEHIKILNNARNENLSLQERFNLSEQLYNLLKQEHDEDEDWDSTPIFNNIDQEYKSEKTDLSDKINKTLEKLESEFYIVVSKDVINNKSVIVAFF